VRRFTEHTRRIFRLRDNDIGRSVDELSGSLDYPDLQQDVREVLRTLVVCERAVSARDGRWYAVRIGPYRDGDDRVQGAVLTFLDITATKLLESRLRGG